MDLKNYWAKTGIIKQKQKEMEERDEERKKLRSLL
jgi:hypothetical protein